MDLLASGRFRKISGSLSGSLHVFYNIIAVPEGSGRCPEACPEACCFFVWLSAIPEDSGRFPEACPEACLNTLIYCIPEASGRFPEDLREGVQNTKFCFWVCKRHKLTTFKARSTCMGKRWYQGNSIAYLRYWLCRLCLCSRAPLLLKHTAREMVSDDCTKGCPSIWAFVESLAITQPVVNNARKSSP